MAKDNRCVICGEIIPEGRQVCKCCEYRSEKPCRICGTPVPKGRHCYCSRECCDKAQRAEGKRKMRCGSGKKPQGIYETCDEIDRYNAAHGTHYSYGWYSYLKERGELKK